MNIKEFDIVQIKGTVVAVYQNGKAFEIEIVSKTGKTLALFSATKEELEVLMEI